MKLEDYYDANIFLKIHTYEGVFKRFIKMYIMKKNYAWFPHFTYS